MGGTAIFVTTRGCVLRNISEDHYKTFHANGKDAPDFFVSRIDVLVTTGQYEINPEMKPIFFGSDKWRMFTNENSYVVEVGNAGSPENNRLLKADCLTNDVEIVVHLSPSVSAQEAPTIADPFRQPIDSILLMNHLAYREGFIVHSAGAVMDGRGVVFAGVSGAGKSTLARQCIKNTQGMKFLSEDRMIVRRVHDEYWVYGTPWNGDPGIARNDSAPLKGLFFLRKADTNRIVAIKPSLAARRLFPVVSCPWYDAERLPQVLDTCEKVVSEIPCFELQFTPDERAVKILSDFIGNEL